MKKVNNELMNVFEIKFKQPKVLGIGYDYNSADELVLLYVLIDWYEFGKAMHKIYKINDVYHWTDDMSPIPVRTFYSIDDLMWEFELPKSLKKEIEEL
jgi:hypothetical protein